MHSPEPGAPASGAHKEAHKSLSHRISGFIHTSRKLIFGVVAAALAFLVVLAVYTGITSSSENAAALAEDALATSVSEWNGTQDAAKKAELEAKVTAAADAIVAKHPRSVYAQEALDVKASIAVGKKDWAAAEKLWEDGASRLPSSFLAPVFLQNAAMAAEEAGANDRAKAHWQAFVDKYSGVSPGIARAWFSLGRLAEESKDYTSAIAAYEKIAGNWPDSDWTKLAKDRIIFLKSRGLAK